MNHSLRLTVWFIQVLKILIILFTTVFILVIGYSWINPNAFETLVVERITAPGFGIGNFRFCTDCKGEAYLFLADLSSGMKLWLLARGMLLFSLSFLILQTISKIVQSVKSNTTFYEGNIVHFKRMSNYGFIAAIFSSFNFFIQSGQSTIDFMIPFGPIAFALACLILAEVFKEGKLLMEDKNSII